MLTFVKSLLRLANSRSLTSIKSSAITPSIQKGSELVVSRFKEPREVWLENLDCEDKLGLLRLNSKVFASTPRMDIIHLNIEWQRKYRFVSFAHAKLRFECRGGGR